MKDKTFKVIYLVLAILPLIATIILLPSMQNQIPVHYNAAGMVNRWGSKYESLLMPVITIVTAIIFFIINKKITEDKKYAGNSKLISYTTFSVISLFSVISFIILYMGYNQIKNLSTTNFYQILSITLSIMFITIGNIMPKSRPNKYIGFRVKWTRNNDQVWAKTNRLTGILFVLTGIFGIFSSIFLNGMISLFLIIILIILTVIIGCFYSYKIYSKINK